METASQKGFSLFLRLIALLIGCLALSCSRDDGRWIPFNDNLSPQKKREVKASFWNNLKKLERETGKKSSLSVYKKMGNLANLTEKEKINDYDRWILGEPWENDSPQAMFLLENIKLNEKALKKLSEGARLNYPLFPITPLNETLVPLFLDYKVLGLLHLADAKQKASGKIASPKSISTTLDDEINLVLDVLFLGGHLMCDNAFSIHYITGNSLRINASSMLQWFVENNQDVRFDGKKVIQKILDHEKQRNAMPESAFHELTTIRESLVDNIRKNLPPDPSKNVINNMRQGLARHLNRNIDNLSDKEVMEYFSIDSLNRYFDEFISALKEFYSLPPDERERRYEEYKKRFHTLYPNRSPWLSGHPFTDFFDAIRRETLCTARLRLVVTALALQVSAKENGSTSPEEALQSLGIPPIWAFDPFTGKPFKLERPYPHKARLFMDTPKWCRETNINSIYVKNMAIEFYIP